MDIQLRSCGVLSRDSSYRLYTSAWSERECDRVIQFLKLVKEWVEQDNADEKSVAMTDGDGI